MRQISFPVIQSGGGGADPLASFITVNPEASLTNERSLAAGTGISITDLGPGSTLTIAASADASLSKTLSYTGTQLTGIVSSAGTKTLSYTGSKLTSIVGTGEYKSKNFGYTGDQLTSVTVL